MTSPLPLPACALRAVGTSRGAPGGGRGLSEASMPTGVYPRATAHVRFWSKVNKTGTCWLWTGFKDRKGYGRFNPAHRRSAHAHRFAYEDVVGPIPDGLTIDHLCRVPGCVRPNHLEPVTMRENVLRGFGPTALNAKKRTCRHGHPYSGDNLRIAGVRYRVCRACNRRWCSEYRKRKKVG